MTDVFENPQLGDAVAVRTATGARKETITHVTAKQVTLSDGGRYTRERGRGIGQHRSARPWTAEDDQAMVREALAQHLDQVLASVQLRVNEVAPHHRLFTRVVSPENADAARDLLACLLLAAGKQLTPVQGARLARLLAKQPT